MGRNRHNQSSSVDGTRLTFLGNNVRFFMKLGWFAGMNFSGYIRHLVVIVTGTGLLHRLILLAHGSRQFLQTRYKVFSSYNPIVN